MKKYIWMAALAAMVLASCEDVETPGPVPYLEGFLLLNNGNMGSNDASVALYNPETKEVAGDLFFNVNGRQLGDLGQDIVRNGNELYISVNCSQIVFVTDLELKVIGEITASRDGGRLSPRSLAVSGSKVYVTYSEGWLGEISRNGGYSVRLTEVGSYPEDVCIYGDRAYVANSGNGDGNTVSVVDLNAFSEISRIEVNRNPQSLVVDEAGKNLYVCSWDAYDPSTWEVVSSSRLQKVSLSDGEVSDLEFTSLSKIVEGPDNQMYVACGQYSADWKMRGIVYKYDMSSGKNLGLLFDEPVENYYSISYDGGYVFIGAGEYTAEGDMYIYDNDGRLIAATPSCGINPMAGLYLGK
ncbi:MAG: YncE family protein [Candidatus Cryptobacteroides sp.]